MKKKIQNVTDKTSIKESGISWTNYTWNPWRGCARKSAGCRICYMFREQTRYGNDPTVVTRCTAPIFNKPLKLRDPAMIFTCSWSDFFIKEADLWRDEAWEIIRKTPQNLYQLLTKRPDLIADRLPVNLPRHIMLGVTCEDLRAGVPMLEMLRQIPNVRRFASSEPLLEDLGEIDLTGYEWAIIGGESGNRDERPAPMHIDWVLGIIRQCVQQQVKIHFKQWSQVDIDGKYHHGIKSLGREVDGVVWDEFPAFTVLPSAARLSFTLDAEWGPV